MIAAIQILQSMGYVVTLEGNEIVLEYRGSSAPDATQVDRLVEIVRNNKQFLIDRLQIDLHVGWELVEELETDTVKIPSEFFTRRDDTCYACGKADSWDKAGQRICSICHPQPNQPIISKYEE